mmetsp:Transcript_26599/g.57881  ORF Transcript_26599/g.57881 Transcript_26599/m.57881 type:complete len:589 (-) Transcript_26599:115-1881(-)|eukprot:CAMPEP_0118930390 /NCGR_PEP_ID=MMETSP1169-20130426/7090_1 /TAXON_ID=36882 /ORGANISM="Pyramimonas obovata, Strain CCMP722" /LENGTH=588 /DNA_ID=CAMNT_0006872737 /DNA_START=127 /DNA_END=1893 /DNA_ORIENTATION=+
MASFAVARATTVGAVAPGVVSSAKPSGSRPVRVIAKSARVQRVGFEKSFLSRNAGQLSAAISPVKAAAPKRSTVIVQASDGAVAVPEPDDRKFLGIPYSTYEKVIPLGFMFFCILFNYTILRDTKDVLVVTAPGSGAEVIPFLKTWVNLPMAIGFMIGYSKLVNVLSTETLFYVVIAPFLAFFASFAFILYPNRDWLHPNELADKLMAMGGERAMGPVSILRNWTYCLFYVMAELWGSVVVSVLFWGFSNQIIAVEEAKQFYPLFGLGANVALIFSGQTVKYFSEMRATLGEGVDGWGISLKGMMAVVVGFGMCIIGVYYWLNRVVVPKIEAQKAAGLMKTGGKKKKSKEKMGVAESIKYLASSPYIRDLALLVVSYGICINLVEVTWKGKIKAQYPNPNDYSAFMGNFSTATGIVTFIMMITSRYIFSKFGWGVAALITPTVLLATGAIFFALVIFSGTFAPLTAALGVTPLFLAVIVGAAQNIFSKSSKYALFDPCKEMAYIPLDDETKTKGKAAIDVVCNPLGKSGGALIQQFLIIGFGSLAASTPYLAFILLFFTYVWIKAASSLDKQFTALTAEDMESDEASA